MYNINKFHFSLGYNRLSDDAVPHLIKAIQALKNLERLGWVDVQCLWWYLILLQYKFAVLSLSFDYAAVYVIIFLDSDEMILLQVELTEYTRQLQKETRMIKWLN